jgi:hypothetical protein
MKKLTSQGFTAFEAILIVVILAIIAGTGFYVYHANKKASDTLNTASKAQSEPSVHKNTGTKLSASSQGFFTIKEWGVRAPYTGSDTFSYGLEDGGQSATVLSKKVTASDSACTTYGAGQIGQYLATDSAGTDDSDLTVAQDAKDHPGLYTKVGENYYRFFHDQAGCKDINVQNEANQTVKALVSKLEAVPSASAAH